jgi:UDP-glucose 4-epimerase
VRVLITGGAGFIGSHLADACIRRGDAVCVLDDMSTGRASNIAHLATDPNFQLVEGSITDEALVARLVKDCDAIYHLAASIGMKLVIERPLRTFETNVRGTEVMFAQAAAAGKPVLFASTSEIYGLNEHKPSNEGDLSVLGDTTKKRWNYAYTKAAGEILAMAYHAERNLPVAIIRLFNTVGTRQTGRYGMVVPTFVRQALAGEPLTVHGDGSQTRCFADVTEVVEAIIAVANQPKARGRVVNLGTNNEISIRELALRVKGLTNSPSELVYVPHDVAYEHGFDEIKRRIPDITLARQLVGFDPKAGIDAILHGVIAEQKRRLVVA